MMGVGGGGGGMSAEDIKVGGTELGHQQCCNKGAHLGKHACYEPEEAQGSLGGAGPRGLWGP